MNFRLFGLGLQTEASYSQRRVTFEGFIEARYSLGSNGPLNARLGRNGREFFKRHYAWPVI